MDKVKVIVKRPLNHYLIICVYILAPLGNILTIRTVGGVPFDQIMRNFFEGFGLFAGLWLLTAPLVGIGFYFVHKTSWYIFIAHSSLIIIDFFYKWISRPVYFMKVVSGSHNLLMLGGNIILILIVGYVVQKNFRAPYFQALQRHWRESIRIPIHHIILIDGKQMDVDDLSTGGCFVIKSDFDLDLDKDHDISFKSDRLEISCQGQIMRQTDQGYGIMFKNLGKDQKQDIHHFLKKRFSLRQQIRMDGKWIYGGLTQDITLLDISKGGCFAASDLKEVKEHDSGVISFIVAGSKHDLHATVTWINQEGQHRKPEGFGCQFRIGHKKLMQDVVNEFGGMGLTR